MARGLSPSTRGNLVHCRFLSSPLRSIPVHAGEPGYACQWDSSQRVYPRPRGGTQIEVDWDGDGLGLSPSTRGNHLQKNNPAVCLRSIPVHAGEPE